MRACVVGLGRSWLSVWFGNGCGCSGPPVLLSALVPQQTGMTSLVSTVKGDFKPKAQRELWSCVKVEVAVLARARAHARTHARADARTHARTHTHTVCLSVFHSHTHTHSLTHSHIIMYTHVTWWYASSDLVVDPR